MSWLLVMRHAKAPSLRLLGPGVRPLKPTERIEPYEVGVALARYVNDVRRADGNFAIGRVLHERSPIARSTAAAVAMGYAYASEDLKRGDPSYNLPKFPEPKSLDGGDGARESSAYDQHFGTRRKAWLDQAGVATARTKFAAYGGSQAALLVLHDPGATWLLRSLQRRWPGVGPSVVVPALARSELIALELGARGTWRARWVLSPGDNASAVESLRAKIRSKMDVAKVLGAVHGREKVPAGGQLRSPLVATRSLRWWPREVPVPR